MTSVRQVLKGGEEGGAAHNIILQRCRTQGATLGGRGWPTLEPAVPWGWRPGAGPGPSSGAGWDPREQRQLRLRLHLDMDSQE